MPDPISFIKSVGGSVNGAVVPAGALRSSGVHIMTADDPYITDANDAPVNESILINLQLGVVKNMPDTDDAYAFLYTYGFSATYEHGKIQVAECTTPGSNIAAMYFRFELTDGVKPLWSDWMHVAIHESTLNFSNVFIGVDDPVNIPFADMNDMPLGQSFLIYVSSKTNKDTLANLPIYDEGYGMTFAIPFSAYNKHGFMQLFVFQTANNPTGPAKVYFRMETGEESRYTFTQWTELGEKTKAYSSVIKGHSADIFTKVVCCGDSYTSGHIYLSATDGSTTNENFAWPKFMSKLTGNDWINCGKSGANVITWQTDPRGLPKAQSSGKAQAYVVGLGLNDTADGTSRYVELGTSADIGTDAQTYYGQYSKIIRELHAISPDAKIFVETMPATSGLRADYNVAVRTIAKQYASTYDVHLLDLANYMELYGSSELAADAIQGHYTAIGYQKFAEYLRYVMSEYIDSHVPDFQDVYKIPTE